MLQISNYLLCHLSVIWNTQEFYNCLFVYGQGNYFTQYRVQVSLFPGFIPDFHNPGKILFPLRAAVIASVQLFYGCFLLCHVISHPVFLLSCEITQITFISLPSPFYFIMYLFSSKGVQFSSKGVPFSSSSIFFIICGLSVCQFDKQWIVPVLVPGYYSLLHSWNSYINDWAIHSVSYFQFQRNYKIVHDIDLSHEYWGNEGLSKYYLISRGWGEG